MIDQAKEAKWAELKAKLGKETVYFADAFEDAVFKSVPREGDYVKRRGKPEFKAKVASVLVTEAMLAHEAITEEDYVNFT